jgi:hypothetical protein
MLATAIYKVAGRLPSYGQEVLPARRWRVPNDTVSTLELNVK